MPSATQLTDDATLAEYDLAPDKTCSCSPHPDHERCGAVATYSLEGWDAACSQPWLTYACDWHAHNFWQAAREGRWCICTGHTGHVMVDIALSRLV